MMFFSLSRATFLVRILFLPSPLSSFLYCVLRIDTLRRAFVAPGRFDRVLEVIPRFPADVIETLQIHATDAQQRAGRPLLEDVDWQRVVGQISEPSTGDWVRILHAVLRRKARCEAGGESVTPVTTQDLKEEVDRFRQALKRIQVPDGGNYL